MFLRKVIFMCILIIDLRINIIFYFLYVKFLLEFYLGVYVDVLIILILFYVNLYKCW